MELVQFTNNTGTQLGSNATFRVFTMFIMGGMGTASTVSTMGTRGVIRWNN